MLEYIEQSMVFGYLMFFLASAQTSLIKAAFFSDLGVILVSNG